MDLGFDGVTHSGNQVMFRNSRYAPWTREPSGSEEVLIQWGRFIPFHHGSKMLRMIIRISRQFGKRVFRVPCVEQMTMKTSISCRLVGVAAVHLDYIRNQLRAGL